MVLVGKERVMTHQEKKDEFGTKYPRLRRTLSAANFTGASRRGFSNLNNDDIGKF